MTYQDLVKHFGSELNAAISLGFTRQAVYHWKINGEIPPKTQAWIQLETSGKLKAAKKAKRG